MIALITLVTGIVFATIGWLNISSGVITWGYVFTLLAGILLGEFLMIASKHLLK